MRRWHLYQATPLPTEGSAFFPQLKLRLQVPKSKFILLLPMVERLSQVFMGNNYSFSDTFSLVNLIQTIKLFVVLETKWKKKGPDMAILSLSNFNSGSNNTEILHRLLGAAMPITTFLPVPIKTGKEQSHK